MPSPRTYIMRRQASLIARQVSRELELEPALKADDVLWICREPDSHYLAMALATTYSAPMFRPIVRAVCELVAERAS